MWPSVFWRTLRRVELGSVLSSTAAKFVTVFLLSTGSGALSANIKRDQFDLSDKTVLITGGAGLLGREHAYAVLANNGSVVLADRDQEALEVALDTFPSDVTSRVSLLPLDITSERELSDLVAGFEREGRNIDVLVNNAAINPQVSANLESRDPSRLENYSVDRWNLEISVGLTGAFLCAKHVGSFMARSRGGVILNIASDLSVISPPQTNVFTQYQGKT